jgi:23S rRNA pseudouridine1911/1915/1917 synthase
VDNAKRIGPRRRIENIIPSDDFKDAGEGASLIYLDEKLAVINKPAGISLATSRSDPDAAARRLVAAIRHTRLQSSGLATGPLWLVHRLDLTTTGLVLIARDAGTHRELSGLFHRRSIEKTYIALVWGHPRPGEGVYDWPIGMDQRDRRRMRIDSAGRPAVTEYLVLAKAPHVSLVELHPKTGRTHQLRVHLAQAGHWIVGVDLYAGARHRGVRESDRRRLLNPPHLLLHAWRLALPDTTTMACRNFEAPLPHAFEAVLEHFHLKDAVSRSAVRTGKSSI